MQSDGVYESVMWNTTRVSEACDGDYQSNIMRISGEHDAE